MKTKLVLILILLISMKAMAQKPGTLNLMPVPAKIQLHDGKFRITSKFTVAVRGDETDSILFKAVNRSCQSLKRKTAVVFNQQYITTADTSTLSALFISITTKASFAPGINESYILNVDSDHISLVAPNTIGALRGLQTLIQLCDKDDEGYYIHNVFISDFPRFKWRGLMIDVARHFISEDVIKRNIEAMASVKMNVLHLHLTDDEGFRVESDIFPMLHAKGSNGDYYTREQLRDMVRFADERGIMIVPEFDMPGHVQSWLAGYPELASQPGPYRPGPRNQWQNEHPDPNRPKSNSIADMVSNLEAPTFDATNERVYDFLDKFIAEMTTIFPSSYIHIGADENNGLVWKLNPVIATWMQKHDMQSTDDLQNYFVSHMYEIVKKNNRQMIGWEEIYNAKLPKDAIVQKWIPENNSNIIKSYGTPAQISADGYRTIISSGFYLDVFMPAYIHYNNPAIAVMNDENIIGGEAAQWTEIADNENIEGRIWPRAGAVAERLWSPASVKDVEDMYRRIFVLNHQLDEQGLLNISNYERFLRRISNNKQVSGLKILTDVLEPVKGYSKMLGRLMKGPAASYQTTPLTSVSDIVFVDSETKRNFRMLVKTYLEGHDEGYEKSIRNYLVLWQKNDNEIQSLFPGNKCLMEVYDHSVNLSLAAAIGLDALDRLAKRSPADSEWIRLKTDELNTFSKAHGETQLAVIPEIIALVMGNLAPEPESYPVF